MRYCGIDVSGTPNDQQLCTLHERRGSDGTELVASSSSPVMSRRSRGPCSASAAKRSPPSTARPAIASTCSRPARLCAGACACRTAFERHRVCDALLFRRRLPLYPVPAVNQPLAAWERRIGLGFEIFEALRRSAFAEAGKRPQGASARRTALRPPLRDVPSPSSARCRRPLGRRSARRGVQERIAALRARAIVDATAAVASHPGRAHAAPRRTWHTRRQRRRSRVGDRARAVTVRPVEELPRTHGAPLAAARMRAALA